VDGVPRARNGPEDEVQLPDSRELDLPLEMGSGEWTMFGTVDEICVHRAVREELYVLPENMRLVGDVDEVRFDATGALDRLYHSGPVRVGISVPEDTGRGEVRWVTIGMMGSVREER
jgi:hypothetical protein